MKNGDIGNKGSGFTVTSNEVEVVGEAKSLGVKSPLWKKKKRFKVVIKFNNYCIRYRRNLCKGL
jgi:hypothetical protein